MTPPTDRPSLYRRISKADAVVVPLDHGSAVESRIPTKVYDCLATGVPLISLCPRDAAVLSAPGSARIHHFEPEEARRLATFLTDAAADRSVLRSGPVGDGHTRTDSAARFRKILEDLVPVE